jgi:hypothetical protein
VSHHATVTLKTKPTTVVVAGKKKGPKVTLKPKRDRSKCHARLKIGGVDIYAETHHLAGITERQAVELHSSLNKILRRIKWTIKRWDL